jgi:hypothetical protein
LSDIQQNWIELPYLIPWPIRAQPRDTISVGLRVRFGELLFQDGKIGRCSGVESQRSGVASP